MLPQNLVQNLVITNIEDNQFKINWAKAAQLVNLNFYISNRSIDESANYRLNQYPYTRIQGPTQSDISTEALKAIMAQWDLHTVCRVEASMLDAYSSVFEGSPVTLIAGSDIVRISTKYGAESASFTDDFFLVVPTIAKYFYSPNGWYVSTQPGVNITHIRQPLWGLMVKRQFNLTSFSVVGEVVTGQTKQLATYTKLDGSAPAGGRQALYCIYRIDSETGSENDPHIDTYADAFHFAEDKTPNFAVANQSNFDRVWGRILDTTGVKIMDVLVRIERRLVSINVDDYLYQYTIIIPAETPSTGYLELY